MKGANPGSGTHGSPALIVGRGGERRAKKRRGKTEEKRGEEKGDFYPGAVLGVEGLEGVLDGADHLLRRRRPQPRRHAEEEGHRPRPRRPGGATERNGTERNYGVAMLSRVREAAAMALSYWQGMKATPAQGRFAFNPLLFNFFASFFPFYFYFWFLFSSFR